MTSIDHSKTSKFLSFVLRHQPQAIGLSLDAQGWASIDELIIKANLSDHGIRLSHDLLLEVVASCDKKRFTVSEDGKNIRAAQGHSVAVDLQLIPVEPPEFLYHGTATRFLENILKEGLKPQQRQSVHLSSDVETATAVGQRYGKPIVLKIEALRMYKQGFKFYQAENGVWLVSNVPAEHIHSTNRLLP